MALIYTHNSSPRKFKRVIKTKSFYKAKQEQDKLLKSMGIDPNRRLRRPRVSIPLDQVDLNISYGVRMTSNNFNSGLASL